MRGVSKRGEEKGGEGRGQKERKRTTIRHERGVGRKRYKTKTQGKKERTRFFRYSTSVILRKRVYVEFDPIRVSPNSQFDPQR